MESRSDREDRAMLMCALRHLSESCRVPRTHPMTVNAAANLLAMGWHPTCTHTVMGTTRRLHHFTDGKRRYNRRPMPWYVKPEPDVNDCILFVGSWQPFVAAHWGA